MKIDYTGLINSLRKGEYPACPQCKDGKIVSDYDYAISHYYHCDKCDMEINID